MVVAFDRACLRRLLMVVGVGVGESGLVMGLIELIGGVEARLEVGLRRSGARLGLGVQGGSLSRSLWQSYAVH